MFFQELNAMLIRALYFDQASIIAAVVCSLIVAGLLKGTIGVGLPVVALPLFIDIKSAAMLLSMPQTLASAEQPPAALALNQEKDPGERRVGAVAVPHTEDVIGDTGTIADCVRAKVRFCIRTAGSSDL